MTTCPLCLEGKNNEIHIALRCKKLAYERSVIQVGSKSLSLVLDQLMQRSDVIDEIDALRMFLGDNKMGLSKDVMQGKIIAVVYTLRTY